MLKILFLFVLSFFAGGVFADEDLNQDELSYFEDSQSYDFLKEDEYSQEDIYKALKLISEFRVSVKQCHNFTKSEEAVDNLLKNLNDLLPNMKTIPEDIEKELFLAFTEYANKYHDELLAENGFYLKGSYPGGYKIRFKTSTKYNEFEFPWFKQYRKIRFRIDETPNPLGGLGFSFDKLTNVKLVLLDRDKYELTRLNIGSIQEHGWSTGEFVISESDYQNLGDAALITDQDL